MVQVDSGTVDLILEIPDLESFRMKTLEIHGFRPPNQWAGKIIEFHDLNICVWVIAIPVSKAAKDTTWVGEGYFFMIVF